MTDRRAVLAGFHTLEGIAVPALAGELSEDGMPDLAWRNELGGLTFRVRDGYLKWNPRGTGIDLARERRRLAWLADRHPVPVVLDYGEDADAQWLLTAPVPGLSAVADEWLAKPAVAIRAIAEGLRAIHALPVKDVPEAFTAESWVGRTPAAIGPRPPIASPVIVHGDACAPNTLIGDDGTWIGHVDLGDLAVGDRWADLAVASMSLDWNYGEGHQPALFDAYGIAPDEERIRWYRALWDLESQARLSAG